MSPPELPAIRERLAIAALALAAFALNLNTSVLGALLPFVPEAFGAHATLMLAAAGFGSAFGALLVVPLARAHGRRAALLAGLAVFFVASLLHLLAENVWFFVTVRALSGLSVGVAYAAASALAAEITPYARRGASMGMFNAGMFLAIPVGMPLCVVLAQAGHWPAIFAVQAAIAGIGFWWASSTLPPVAIAGVEARVPHRAVLARASVLAGLAATLLHVGSFFTTVQLAAKWLDVTGRVPKADQIWLWVGLGGASVLGSALLGRLADVVGKRNFVLATSALLVGALLVITREPEQAWLLAAGSVMVVTAAARTGPLQALVSGLVPRDHVGLLMAWRGFAMQAGVGAVALAATPLVDRFGFRGMLLLAAGCQAASYLAIRLWVHEGSDQAK